MTHKRWIYWKRYGEGKTSEQVARETYHSLEAVDRYLGQFDRVRHCRREGLSIVEKLGEGGMGVVYRTKDVKLGARLKPSHAGGDLPAEGCSVSPRDTYGTRYV